MHLPMSIHCGNGWTCGSVHFCCFEADFVVICHMGMKGRCLLCWNRGHGPLSHSHLGSFSTCTCPISEQFRFLISFSGKLGVFHDKRSVATLILHWVISVFCISLFPRLFLSHKFGLRPKISQKVKSFFLFSLSNRSVCSLVSTTDPPLVTLAFRCRIHILLLTYAPW